MVEKEIVGWPWQGWMDAERDGGVWALQTHGQVRQPQFMTGTSPGVASAVAIPINFTLPLLWLARWGYIYIVYLYLCKFHQMGAVWWKQLRTGADLVTRWVKMPCAWDKKKMWITLKKERPAVTSCWHVSTLRRIQSVKHWGLETMWCFGTSITSSMGQGMFFFMLVSQIGWMVCPTCFSWHQKLFWLDIFLHVALPLEAWRHTRGHNHLGSFRNI